MSLRLYSHPLASFCWKPLIALYENGTPFEPVLVDLGDPASVAAFKALWPMAKMPVLHDTGRGQTVAESTIIVEYLDTHYPGDVRFVPADPDQAWRVRMWDRFYDHYVQVPMQKIVVDNLRPDGEGDAFGVEEARGLLHTAYGVAEAGLAGHTWAGGEDFTLADCAAAPALFYANAVCPFRDGHPSLAAYFDRLTARPAVSRVLREAEPYFEMVPIDDKPKLPEMGSAAGP